MRIQILSVGCGSNDYQNQLSRKMWELIGIFSVHHYMRLYSVLNSISILYNANLINAFKHLYSAKYIFVHLSIRYKHIPLKRGHIVHILTGLRLTNWPRDTSKKNSGIPHSTRKMKYGIKKAPVERFQLKSESILGYILINLKYLLLI